MSKNQNDIIIRFAHVDEHPPTIQKPEPTRPSRA